MITTPGAPIVVGVDGSDSSLDAVDLAAHEAAVRGRALRVVHAFVWPLMPGVPLGPPSGGPADAGLRHEAERLVADAVEAARKAAPEVAVTGEIVEGAPARVLLGEASTAHMVVLGDRGLGGFGDLILGSVAAQVASHATCPVLVARGTRHPQAPIVVGVDGSEVSEHATGFAFEEASLRGASLVAVHAWRFPVSSGPGDLVPLVYDRAELVAEEQRVLAEAIAGWCERYPDVEVTKRVHRGRPGKTLIEESDQAQLLVVGARGRGGFTGLLLGSVSHAVLNHSRCPVAIVHR